MSGKRGTLSIAVQGLLTVGASLVAEHRLLSVDSVAGVQGLSCSAACGIFPDEGGNPRPCIVLYS